VEPKLKRGQLVRWAVDYEYYAAPSTSHGVMPQKPIYMYGIVLEVSETDSGAVVVFCFQDGTWSLLNMLHDQFEILSGD
jgi:hypothetical protein